MNDMILASVPKDISKYTKLLADFLEGMMRKLDKNSHKDTPTIKTVPAIIDDMMLEVDEFEEQFFDDKDNENTLVELFDIANFAFLAYVALRMQGVQHEQDSRSA